MRIRGSGTLVYRLKGDGEMRFGMRLVVVSAICAGLGIVAAPVAGAADTQPPTAPSNVRVLAVTPDTVTIAFTGSTDDVGLKWYVARVEGVRRAAHHDAGRDSDRRAEVRHDVLADRRGGRQGGQRVGAE